MLGGARCRGSVGRSLFSWRYVIYCCARSALKLTHCPCVWPLTPELPLVEEHNPHTHQEQASPARHRQGRNGSLPYSTRGWTCGKLTKAPTDCGCNVYMLPRRSVTYVTRRPTFRATWCACTCVAFAWTCLVVAQSGGALAGAVQHPAKDCNSASFEALYPCSFALG